MLKEVRNKVLKHIGVYIFVLIILCLLLIISFSLPDKLIRKNLKESVHYIRFISINDYPIFSISDNISGHKLDRFSDFLILNTALGKNTEKGSGIIYKAFFGTRYTPENNQKDGLIKSIENDNLLADKTYINYWIGSEIFVRFLLLIFNYEEILYIYMIVTFILLFITLYYINKNLNIFYTVAFGLAMLFVEIPIVSYSLQLAPIFLLTFVGIIILNILYEKKKMRYLSYFFMILGMLSCYFDLLSVPLISLGMCLIISLLLKFKSEEKVLFREYLGIIIKYSTIWFVSYAFMFLSKWIIASLVSHKNEFGPVIKQMLYRVDGQINNIKYSLKDVLKQNILKLINKSFDVIMIIIVYGYIIRLVYLEYKQRIKKENFLKSIILLIVSLYPYIWYSVLKNHSFEHSFMTYRLQAITLFGIFSFMILSSNTDSKKQD